MTTGWVLSPIVVIALLAATFEGYGFYTRHQKTVYSRGGQFGAVPASQTNANGGHAHGRTGRAGSNGSGGHGAKKGAGHVKNGGTKITTLSNGSNNPGTSSGSHHAVSSPHHQAHSSSPTPTKTTSHPTGTTPALVTPQPGVYNLAVSGSETAKFGPISACKNNFPGRATIDVHHAAGESPTSYDFDMRLYPGQSNRHDERHIYDYSKSGMVLTYEQETITCTGIKQSSTVDYSPAQTRVETPLAVGNSWHNHGGGTSRTETGTSNVVKQSSIAVQGHSYKVYEIVTKLNLTGKETGFRDQTWWYSPQLAMPLRFSETLHGDRSGAKYSESYTASVVSLP